MIKPTLAFLEQGGLNTRGNPDIYIREYPQFGIEEARELRLRASSRAIKEKQRIFIIAASNMTAEAQNALLKTLEEPPADAVFYFLVSSPETLLPTLLSRVQVLRLAQASPQEEIIDAGRFLRAARTERMEMLKELLPKDKEERNIGAIVTFLASLERVLYETGAKKGAAREGIQAVYLARKYAADKGSLLKPLLEQVALLI